MKEAKDSLKKNDTVFDSGNIGKQPKKEYFVRVRKRFNFLDLLKGWRKFAVLGGVVVVAVVVIIIINVRGEVTHDSSDAVYDFGYVETANGTYQAAMDVMQQNSDNAYFDAVAVFDRAIADNGNNEKAKNEITYMKAQFYQKQNANEDAIAVLLELKSNDQLTEAQRAKVLNLLIAIYRFVGADEKADELRGEFNKLYGGGE